MKTYEELKVFCDKEIEKYPMYFKRYRKEIAVAYRVYSEKRNLYEEMLQRKKELDDRYVIPFLLGLTERVNLDKHPEYIKVKEGSSGGKPVPLIIGI